MQLRHQLKKSWNYFLKTGLTKGKYSAKLVSSSKSFVSQQTEDLRIKGRGAGPLVVLKEPNEMCQYDKGRAEGPCTKVSWESILKNQQDRFWSELSGYPPEHRKLVILTGLSARGLREAREARSISEAFVTGKHLQSFMKARFSEFWYRPWRERGTGYDIQEERYLKS